MAVDIETIGIAVDTTGVVKGERELKSFGATADKASRNADGLTSSIGGLAKSFIGAYAGIQGFAAAVKSLDQFARYEAIIKNATRTQAEFNKAMSESTRIANAAQSDIDGIARTYARFSNALRDFNATQGQVSDLTETVALALKANGASATETSSAMLQLSQAFGAGRLSGDEFRSMAEAAPNLMRDLARSIGVPVGALKDMGAEGQLTTEMLLKAFTNRELLATYRKQASEIRTIGGAWQELVNTITVGLAKVDKEIGTSRFFQGLLGQFSMGIKVLTGQTETYLDGVIKKSVQAGEAILNAMGIQSKAQKDADAERRKRAGSGIFGDANPITYGGQVMPGILSQPVGPIDVNKLHKAQEEERRKLELINQERRKAADEAAKYERELARAESAWRANKANEYQEELRKKYEKAKQEEARIAEELAKEEYKSKLKYMDMLSKEAEQNYNEAQKAAKKAADELEREYERISDNISRSLTDAIFRGFEKGKSFVDNFIDTLKNTFKTVVLQPVIKGIVDSTGITAIGKSIGSIFAGGTDEGGNKASFNQGSIISRIEDVFYKTNARIIGGIEDLGARIANGMGGVRDSIGGFMGQYASQIADGLSYGGAVLQLAQGNIAGAALTAIGTYFGGPLGGAIGGAIGSLFGGKVKTKKYSTGVTGLYSDGQFTSKNQSGLSGYGRALGGNDGLAMILKDYSTVVSGLFDAFGMGGDVKTSASLFQRSSKKTRAWGYFGASIGDASVSTSSGPNPFGSAQEAMNALINNILTKGITGLIAKSEMPEGIKQLFEGLTDKTSVQAMINASINIGNAQDALIRQYGLTADTAGKVAIASGYAGEQLAQFANALATTALSTQKTSITIIKERDALKELIGSLPDSVTAFDAILKSINTTTADGQKQFADLFELRDRFGKYTSAFDGVVNNVESAIYGLLSPSEKMALDQANLAKAFTELNLAVPTSITELIALGKSIDYGTEAGLDLALAFPALVAMFNQTETAAKSLSDTLNANYFSTRADYMSAKASDSPQSYIKNQSQMNAEMLAQIKKLQQDGEDTKAVMLAVAEYTAKFQRTIDDWDSEGMPAVRVEA